MKILSLVGLIALAAVSACNVDDKQSSGVKSKQASSDACTTEAWNVLDEHKEKMNNLASKWGIMQTHKTAMEQREKEYAEHRQNIKDRVLSKLGLGKQKEIEAKKSKAVSYAYSLWGIRKRKERTERQLKRLDEKNRASGFLGVAKVLRETLQAQNDTLTAKIATLVEKRKAAFAELGSYYNTFNSSDMADSNSSVEEVKREYRAYFSDSSENGFEAKLSALHEEENNYYAKQREARKIAQGHVKLTASEIATKQDKLQQYKDSIEQLRTKADNAYQAIGEGITSDSDLAVIIQRAKEQVAAAVAQESVHTSNAQRGQGTYAALLGYLGKMRSDKQHGVGESMYEEWDATLEEKARKAGESKKQSESRANTQKSAISNIIVKLGISADKDKHMQKFNDFVTAARARDAATRKMKELLAELTEHYAGENDALDDARDELAVCSN